MSAIWGTINKKNIVSKDSADRMRMSMEEFEIDRYEEIFHNDVYFACGHQHFTKEAVWDKSPYYDEKSQIFFAGDCYLYNRNEVIDLLKKGSADLEDSDYEKMGDSMLAYRLYDLMGEQFVCNLKGSFSMAIYEEAKKQVLLYTDHVAQRYLAYYNDEESVCFGTVYQPILAVITSDKKKICKEWIVAAYTDCSADTLRLPGKTAWENIYQVEPGKYVKINIETNVIETITYWNPLKKKIISSKLDDEIYKKNFMNVFENTLHGMLRAKDKTGIMLSGGLDSSAVGAVSANILDKENKQLFSYTSIPVEEFEFSNDAFFIENETELIRAQQKLHPNIVSKFVSVPKVNCFTNLKQFTDTFHQPVKAALNMINVEGMYKEAKEDGCNILLSGQNGNATISYGNLLSYVYQKSVTGHFLQAYKEIKAFGKLRRIARKRIVSVYLKTLAGLRFGKFSFGKDCLLKEEDIKEYELIKENKKLARERGNGILDTKKQRRGFCFMPLVFQHMGFYHTYCSLKYGVLPLDPTLTKDMIELCLSMPIDCYVKNGRERRVIRDYFKGMIPDEILENHTGRGIQGADFAYRINRDWNEIKDDVYEILDEPMLEEFLDEDKLKALINEAKEKEYNMDKNIVARLAVISALGCFLRMAKEK